MANSSSTSVIIDNTKRRYDTAGNPVDAHDGCLEFFEGRYWLYGTAYGATTGFRTSNRYRIYSSPDLAQEGWTCHGEALRHSTYGFYVRPYVKRCPATGKYVMWFNYFTDWKGEMDWAAGDGPVLPVVCRVAVADHPAGPFEIATPAAATRYPHTGDLGLFVDHDGTGYVIYDSPGPGFKLTIERLRDDFLDSAGEGTEPLAEGVEAPALFARGGWYYALFDQTCCFGAQGTGARVYRARHPLGPWEYRGNINRRRTGPLQHVRDFSGEVIIRAQQTHIARLPTAGDDVFLWMGDLWQTGGRENRGADLQFWSEPLRFTADGDIEPLRFVEQWTLTHTPAESKREERIPEVMT